VPELETSVLVQTVQGVEVVAAGESDVDRQAPQ
jgi:hypothetical protein